MHSAMRLLAVAAIAAPLAGCLTFGSIQNRGTTINEGVGAMQNRAVLLNLVRASRSEPLYFLSVNQVQAQSSADLKLGLPQFTFGPTPPRGTPQTQYTFGSNASSTLDNNTNTNFQVGVYNSKDFYAGLLTPLGLDEVDLLFHQGLSRELVFYLVIDKLKVTPIPTGDAFILYNDPTNPASFQQFQGFVKQAMEFGLTTEVPTPEQDEAAGPSRITAQSGAKPGAALGSAGAIQFMLTAQSQPARAQLCFERALATAAAKKQFDALSTKPNYCGQARREEGNATYVVLNGQELKIEVTTRSIYGIFSFLGHIMPDPPVMQPFDLPAERALSGPLLTVRTDRAVSGGCFTAVSYGGKNYCVPDEGEESTKSIFNILTALVALKQSPGDLPATQSVLVAP